MIIKISPSTARLLVFAFVLLFINHMLACIWIMAAKINDEQNWVLKSGIVELENNPS